jgi:hypothetical protein
MSFTKRECAESKGVQFCVHNYRKLVAVRTGLMFSTPPEMFSILNAHHYPTSALDPTIRPENPINAQCTSTRLHKCSCISPDKTSQDYLPDSKCNEQDYVFLDLPRQNCFAPTPKAVSHAKTDNRLHGVLSN